MDDVILNCLLEVCCDLAAAIEAMAQYMSKELGRPIEECRIYAAWNLNNFDLAEKGTLAPLKASIARVAKAAKHQSES